jgi:hypothetical protein
MRHILLDEGVPIGVRTLVAGFHVEAVAEIGWAGLSNGDLIQAAEEAGFEVMITCDQNIRYQQNLAGRRLAVVVLATNHWDTIRANGSKILPAVEKAAVGSFVIVEIPRPPRRRRRQPLPGEPA